MLVLRFIQFAETQPKQHHVKIELDDNGSLIHSATSNFEFAIDAKDREKLRWYLEDYLQYPFDPAPVIAAEIENHLVEIGNDLFHAVFCDRETLGLYSEISGRLSEVRIEIVTGENETQAVPWELLRDPKSNKPLSLHVNAFVRAKIHKDRDRQIHSSTSGPIRILLVICRPHQGDDVPFRSVASYLINGLGGGVGTMFELDVLRPPTFMQLNHVLQIAKAHDRPYHIVHFDGHGIYDDLTSDGQRHSTQEKRGYLVFENPKHKNNIELIHGTLLGETLVKADVSLLILNACRSAHADAPPKPGEVVSGFQPYAYGSLAQEVMNSGMAGVVAMRYNVYVVTAAQGRTLGEAVTQGRKLLHAQPLRSIAFDPLPLQDWLVPEVYESRPTVLLARRKNGTQRSTRSLNIDATSPTRKVPLDAGLPQRPKAGFFGRDETLLAIDRAFDSKSVVLLHAYAGNGKTATVSEFARWYALTGGVDGHVLFTSFQKYRPLARVLDQIAQAYEGILEQKGINWLALDDNDRARIALEVLEQVSTLWIWDNVEQIAGFPSGKASAWRAAEVAELATFLQQAQGSKVRFLLTSRRDEQTWLGSLPFRLTIPPMPMQERTQLVRALLNERGRRLNEVEDWRPLLRFTLGNPLTITVLVGQVLRDGYRTKAQIETFVNTLRSGEAQLGNADTEGSANSLAVSLNYGFENAFTADEKLLLSLLYLFQGYVNVDLLEMMGSSENVYGLPELHKWNREATTGLLDRAAEIGLLVFRGNGCYSIHPALPWHFKLLFEQHYKTQSGTMSLPHSKSSSHVNAVYAFVSAMAEFGSYYHDQYEAGKRKAISMLIPEESNLLYAQELARTRGWWDATINLMQGLRSLYAHTGRRAEWAHVVDEITPMFADPANDGPISGRDVGWSLVTEYRVEIARQARQWPLAERLQRLRLDWIGDIDINNLPSNVDDELEGSSIRLLANSLNNLGHIQREQGKVECIGTYKDAIKLCQRVNHKSEEAVAAFNLGSAYFELPNSRDLQQARHWFLHGLTLIDDEDHLTRAKSLIALSVVVRQQFQESQSANGLGQRELDILDEARQYCIQAASILPPDVIDDLAVVNHQLGMIYDDVGDLTHALTYYQKSIRYKEATGNMWGVALTRVNVAITLAKLTRFEDALLYADEAMRNYESYGNSAADEIGKVQELIELIKQAQQAYGSTLS